MSAVRIAVFGAGSIGCYVGGRLAAAGARVTLIGRPRMRDELLAHGLRLSDWRGADLRAGPESFAFETQAAAAGDAQLVLVTVKSAATPEAGKALAPVLRDDTVVVSFQNGLRNARQLAEDLPGAQVIAGMVPFNVVNRGQGRFHQGSEGSLELQRSPAMAPFAAAFSAAGLSLIEHEDMPAVLWSKLLLNLNNPLNALSGIPLKAELSQRAYRRCLALLQREALDLLDTAGQPLVRLTPLSPAAIARLLEAPDWLFRLLANRMLAIDPLARSSMWEDLEAGRRTEVDWINGEVVALARTLGRAAPLNSRIVELVREAEAGGRRDWSGGELLARLQGG